jgi:hypothetical protein
MKRVITILLALIPFIAFSQQEGSNDGLINKGSGILYFEGRPSFDPTPFADASEFAIDLNTKKVYIYSGSGSVWNRYNAIDTISVIGDTTGIATQAGKIIYVNATNEHWKVNGSGNFEKLSPVVFGDKELTAVGKIRQGNDGDLYAYDSSVSGERKVQYQNEILVPDTDLLVAIDSATANGLPIRIRKNVDFSGQNVDFSNTEIRFSQGATITADTVTATGAKVIAGIYQIWGVGTIIQGNWDVYKAYVEWSLTPSEDSVATFRGLTNAAEMGLVELQKDTYNLWFTAETTAAGYRLPSNKQLKIIGVDRDSSVVRLTRSLTNNSGGYFSVTEENTNANNIHFENLTFKTKNYENGIVSDNTDYHIYSANTANNNTAVAPKTSSIVIRNCNLYGNVGIRYVTNIIRYDTLLSEYIPASTIEKVEVENIYHDQAAVLLELRGVQAKSLEFKNNQVRNIRNSYVSLAYPDPDSIRQALRNQMSVYEFSNNRFENDSSITTTAQYLAPMIITGANIDFARGGVRLVAENNFVKNLISNGTETATYFIYSGVTEYVCQNNTIENVWGLQNTTNSSLVKVKGGQRVTYLNNVFSLADTVLINAGLISDDGRDSVLNKSAFKFTMFDVSNDPVKFKRLRMIGNTFKMPVLNNASSFSQFSDFFIKDNDFTISRFESSPGNDAGFFSVTAVEGNTCPDCNLISQGNTISVKSNDVDSIHWFITTPNDYADSSNYQKVLFADKFYIDSANVILPTTWGRYYEVDCQNNGTASSLLNFNSTQLAVGDGFNPLYTSSIRVRNKEYIGQQEEVGEQAITHIAPFQETHYTSSINSSDTINIYNSDVGIMGIRRGVSVYAPVLVEMQIEGIDSSGVQFKEKYRWVYRNQAAMIANFNNSGANTINPTDNVVESDTITGIYGGYDFSLVVDKSSSNRHGVRLIGCENIYSFGIVFSVKPIPERGMNTDSDYFSLVGQPNKLRIIGNSFPAFDTVQQSSVILRDTTAATSAFNIRIGEENHVNTSAGSVTAQVPAGAQIGDVFSVYAGESAGTNSATIDFVTNGYTVLGASVSRILNTNFRYETYRYVGDGNWIIISKGP